MEIIAIIASIVSFVLLAFFLSWVHSLQREIKRMQLLIWKLENPAVLKVGQKVNFTYTGFAMYGVKGIIYGIEVSYDRYRFIRTYKYFTGKTIGEFGERDYIASAKNELPKSSKIKKRRAA